MTTTTKAEDRLETIKRRHGTQNCMSIPVGHYDIGWLITEVERLRAKNAELRTKLAAHEICDGGFVKP